MELEINPAYHALVPRPSKEEEAAIEESIKRRGQLFPIAVVRDPQTNKIMILDGHTRYKILKKHGIEPKVEYHHFKSSYEEKAFIIAANLPRRHLNAYQKVMLSMPLWEVESKLASERKRKGASVPNDAKGKTAKKIARMIGVPTRTYERILYIIQNGDDKLKESVESGRTKPAFAEKQIRKRKNIVLPSSFPKGKYSAVVVDPPWKNDVQFANAPEYQTLTTEQIINFTDADGRKIPDLFTDDCVLYLWTTGSKMEDGFVVIREWGLKHSTTMVWVKIRKEKIKFINGYRQKNAAEFVLIATRGNPETPLPENMPDGVFFAEPTGHSAKPDVFYDMVSKAHSNQPKIDVFARKVRQGWDNFGNPPELEQQKDSTTASNTRGKVGKLDEFQ